MHPCTWNKLDDQYESSLAEVLQRDPSGEFPKCDSSTRQRYIKEIVELATWCSRDPLQVARELVTLCENPNLSSRERHVGCWLISELRPKFEEFLGCTVPSQVKLLRIVRRQRTSLYLATIAALAALTYSAIFGALAVQGIIWHPSLALAALLFGAPITIACTGFADRAFLRLSGPPQSLPSLDMSAGIPDTQRTIAVIPVLISSRSDIAVSVQTLERNYLNSPDPNISFALLTDFADSENSSMPEDWDLLLSIKEQIAKLNVTHGEYGVGPFLHFHRDRRWNDADQIWMGWERKRGKLAEFNLLLSGSKTTSFVPEIGDRKRLAGVRLVVTLDADSELTPNGITRLVGILQHPLNRASISKDGGQVTSGYGVLQPRPAQVRSGKENLFERYFHPASDDLESDAPEPSIHQDLFDSGIFFGKGIYNASVFTKSLEGRIPENSVLSHDKLEGFHARTANVSNVLILERAPVNYLTHRKRMHRWIRGDYQLLPWLWAQVPLSDGTRGRTKLTRYDRWRLLYDLTGPASGVSTFLLIAATSIGLLPGNTLSWLTIILLISGSGLLWDTVCSFAKRTSLQSWFMSATRTTRSAFTVWVLGLAFMADSAMVNLDAMARAVYRTSISRRHLLQWVTAAEATRELAATGAGQYWRQMIYAPAFSLVLITLVATLNPAALPFTSPLFLTWLISPQLAYWLEKKVPSQMD